MKKQTAIALLGGTVALVARNLRCSKSAVYAWPDDGPLPRAIADRVIAARVRLRVEVLKAQAEPGTFVLDPLEEDALML